MKRVWTILWTIAMLSTLGLATDLAKRESNVTMQYILYTATPIDIKKELALNSKLQIDQIEKWKENYPIPQVSYLKYFGYGFNETIAEKLYESKFAYRLVFHLDQNKDLLKYKQIDTHLQKLTSRAHGYLWDSESRQLFTAKAWQDERIDEGWQEKKIILTKHIVIHYYQISKGKHRLITLGMKKFGLPDIVITNLFSHYAENLSMMIDLVAHALLDKNTTKNEVILDLDKMALLYPYALNLKNTRYADYKAEVLIKYTKGKYDEGDPDNRLIELLFEQHKDEERYAAQSRYTVDLLGAEDKVAFTEKYNKELQKTSKIAREHLPELKEIFNKSLALNEYISLKAPFPYEDGTEWMWVVVREWDDKSIKGILNNQPYYVKNIKAGDTVIINEDDVFDYIHRHPDGNETGNETGKVIAKYNR